MRKTFTSLLIATALIAASATVASAATVTASPGGSISATIRGLGFSGPLLSLFRCDLALSGSVSTGPITLPGRGGSIYEREHNQLLAESQRESDQACRGRSPVRRP